MSAILSAEDLNDFISPGVACIKPVETLPKQETIPSLNPYEVTTEDKLPPAADAPPASISLTDCLACSGCVTSAEAVLVSLQSHNEVLSMLETHPAVHTAEEMQARISGEREDDGARIFVASVSPQTKASIAATYGVTEREAGNMISQLLTGEHGLKNGGRYGSSFTWVVDTNTVREICQAAVTEEVLSTVNMTIDISSTATRQSSSPSPKLPILASACPGWICYAEKTHPHVLPHLSALRSPQAMSGVLIKSILAKRYSIPPSRVYHVAIMPCFDKKLEASRAELMDTFWSGQIAEAASPIRDTDTVITARELLTLASARGISFAHIPRSPPKCQPFPDNTISSFLFSPRRHLQSDIAGPAGGYAYTILAHLQSQYPGSQIMTTRGRNVDVLEYALISDSGEVILKTARYFGFRNIQNLVRRLKPAKKSRMPGAQARGARGVLGGAENKASRAIAARKAGLVNGANANGDEQGVNGSKGGEEFAYVEVMACPGGCTNGGGQIKAEDVPGLVGDGKKIMNNEDVERDEGVEVNANEVTKLPTAGPTEQKEWLKKVDEAYYSASSSDDEDEHDVTTTNGPTTTRSLSDSPKQITSKDQSISSQPSDLAGLLTHWSTITDIPLGKLLFTTYRQVDSDVGKEKGKESDMERVAGLAGSLGGGW